MSKHPAYRFLTRFDDPGWRGHLTALKPIGLNAVQRGAPLDVPPPRGQQLTMSTPP